MKIVALALGLMLLGSLAHAQDDLRYVVPGALALLWKSRVPRMPLPGEGPEEARRRRGRFLHGVHRGQAGGSHSRRTAG
jgi:hypothetical protein